MGLLLNCHPGGLQIVENLQSDWELFEGSGELPRFTEHDIPWGDLESITGIDPWPAFAVGYGRGSEASRPVFRPTPYLSASELGRAAEMVDELVAVARRRAPALTTGGWVGEPEREWEPVDTFPEAAPSVEGGAYRTRLESVVASRPRGSSFEQLVLWRATVPDLPWRKAVRSAVLTETHLFVEHRDGALFRIALRHQRSSVGTEHDGVVHVFGLRSQALFLARDGCPIVARLAALPSARNEGSGTPTAGS